MKFIVTYKCPDYGRVIVRNYGPYEVINFILPCICGKPMRMQDSKVEEVRK